MDNADDIVDPSPSVQERNTAGLRPVVTDEYDWLPPLFDPSRTTILRQTTIAKLRVGRVENDADGNELPPAWIPERFVKPFEVDEAVIFGHGGGGVYEVQGFDAKSRLSIHTRVRIDGVPRRAAPGAPVNSAAVQQATADGFVFLPGLSPVEQAFLLVMQKASKEAIERAEREATRATENGHKLVEACTAMAEVFANRPQDKNDPISAEVKELLAQQRRTLQEVTEENTRLRKRRKREDDDEDEGGGKPSGLLGEIGRGIGQGMAPIIAATAEQVTGIKLPIPGVDEVPKGGAGLEVKPA